MLFLSEAPISSHELERKLVKKKKKKTVPRSLHVLACDLSGITSNKCYYRGGEGEVPSPYDSFYLFHELAFLFITTFSFIYLFLTGWGWEGG